MADAVVDAGRREVGEEDLVVGLALVGGAVDLLGAPVVAGVGVDGDDLDAVGGGPAEDDGRPALVAADLHDPGRSGELAGPVPQAPGLGFGHPALDVGDVVEGLGKGRRGGGHGDGSVRGPSGSRAGADGRRP